MDPVRRQQLDDLNDCSHSLLERARADDWMVVKDLQGQYRELAEALFSRPVPAEESAAVAAVVRDIILANRQVQELGKAAQQACLDEVGVQRQRRQAVSAYTANQSKR